MFTSAFDEVDDGTWNVDDVEVSKVGAPLGQLTQFGAITQKSEDPVSRTDSKDWGL